MEANCIDARIVELCIFTQLISIKRLVHIPLVTFMPCPIIIPHAWGCLVHSLFCDGDCSVLTSLDLCCDDDHLISSALLRGSVCCLVLLESKHQAKRFPCQQKAYQGNVIKGTNHCVPWLQLLFVGIGQQQPRLWKRPEIQTWMTLVKSKRQDRGYRISFYSWRLDMPHSPFGGDLLERT